MVNIGIAVQRLAASTEPADVRDLAILLLGAQGGLRRSEIAGLQPEDIDLQHCTIRILRKGKRERKAVTIGGATCAALDRWLEIRADPAQPDEASLFVGLGQTHRGRGIGDHAVWVITQRVGGWHPHALRHSAITEILRLSCRATI